jgi:DNA-binding transcriptional ArsR family regulator
MLNYQLDRTFAALADPARRTIVERLASGPATVSELAKPLPMSLPAVMKSEKVGRVDPAGAHPAMLSQAEIWVAERRAMWERNLDRLGAYLDETEGGP